MTNTKNKIRLTESQLHRIIKNCVNEAINESLYTNVKNALNEQMEEGLEEGWFSDKWNQAKSAFNTATQSSDNLGIRDRFSQAKKNWDTQGELNGINNLEQQLSQFVDAGQLSPQMTIAQLIGGKYNNNKFGRMSGMAANRRGQISRRGGTAY